MSAVAIDTLAAELNLDVVEVSRIVLRQFDEWSGEDWRRAPYTEAPGWMGTVEGPDGPIMNMYLADWAIEEIRHELAHPETVTYEQLVGGLVTRGVIDLVVTTPPHTEHDWDIRGPDGRRVALGGEINGWTWSYYPDTDLDGDTDGIEGVGDEARNRMLDAVAYSLKH